jgi:hypothetical protein
MRAVPVLVSGAVLTLLLLGGVMRADEKKVPLDKVPKVVVDAVKTRFAGAEFTGAETETEGGKTVYEIAITHKDQKIEVTLTTEGKITEFEKQIAAKEMLKAAASALRKKFRKAKIKVVEEVYKVKDGEEKLEYYEVLLVTAADKKLEVAVTPEGKITKEEDKSKEKD